MGTMQRAYGRYYRRNKPIPGGETTMKHHLISRRSVLAGTAAAGPRRPREDEPQLPL